MPDFKLEPFDLIRNEQYAFYKLFINGKCLFDSFQEEVMGIPKDRKALEFIFAMMDAINDSVRWRKEKFRQIKDVGRDDVFEFKKDLLRVYVIKKSPDIIVVLGGYKKNQIKEIKRLKSLLKGFEPC